MPSQFTRNLRTYNLVGDIILINISFWVAYSVKYSSIDIFADTQYTLLLLFFNLSWLFAGTSFKLYEIYRVLNSDKIISNLVKTLVLHVLLITAFFVFRKAYYYSREQLITTYLLIVILLALFRLALMYYINRARKSGANFKKVAVVGNNEMCIELSNFFNEHPELGYKYLGFFKTEYCSDEENCLGNYSTVHQYLTTNEIDEIYISLPSLPPAEINKIIDSAEENFIRVKLIPDFNGFANRNTQIDFYGFVPVAVVRKDVMEQPINKFIKRAFDIVFSSLFIIFVLSWVTLIVGIIIKLTSKGPVFYKQLRSGKEYKPFVCWKFRSMRFVKNDEFVQATKDDDRVTAIGKFIRKTSIDEFPQFINVFLGHMSVVGPRPHPLKLDDEYKKIIGKYMHRHFAKPGITGLAQIKGYRGETNDPKLMKARISLDLLYIENWSFFFDLKIILLTIYSLVKGDDKAY